MYKLFWIAERECNKEEMKNRAIFIEFRMWDFHRGIIAWIWKSSSSKTMSSISTISSSDSIMTSSRYFSGPVASESDPTIIFNQYFPRWKSQMRNSMKNTKIIVKWTVRNTGSESLNSKGKEIWISIMVSYMKGQFRLCAFQATWIPWFLHFLQAGTSSGVLVVTDPRWSCAPRPTTAVSYPVFLVQ